MRNFKYYIPGSILIMTAIIIVAVPEILVAFIAASIIMAGIGSLYLGHMIRKSGVDFKDSDVNFFNDDFYGRRFIREPVFRRWL